jgi:DNA-binding response OmpR family regulator
MTAGRMMIGGLNFDFTRRTAAARNGQRVHFTGTDWVALEVLARHSGQPVSRQQLCREVFNRDWAPDDRAVDKLVLRLRRRLRDVGGDAEAIQTVRNRGYALFAGAVPTRPQLVGGSVHDRSSILAFDH